MSVTFTDDERFLIDQLAKTPEEFKKLNPKDLNRVAELLVKHVGDMKFNKKLRKYAKELDQLETDDDTQNDKLYKLVVNLAKFTYKTQDYEAIESINKKIQINKQLAKQGLEIAEEEKLSLKEIGRVMKFSDFSIKAHDDKFNQALQYISQNSKNKDFEELYENISLSHATVLNIQQKIIKSSTYKTNDMSVVNINKDNIVKNNNPALFDTNGAIVNLFLSGHRHTAPLYVKNTPRTNKLKTVQSHIDEHYEIIPLEALDVLGSDTFRIDVTKLINKNFVGKLQKVYGEKEWKTQIQKIYKDFSDDIHNNFQNRQQEIDNLTAVNIILDNQYKNADLRLKHPQNKLSEEIIQLEQNKEFLNSEIQKNKTKINFLSNTIIKIDSDRLSNINKWIGPKALIQGHTKLGHKNDFRALSNEMFNPTEENKKMICSEFGAVTIAASIDQLNRIVALDLQAAGLIDKEQEIFKNPIPKNERIDKIHPGRLVHLLKKAGAVEVRNETVDQYVKRNDLTSMKTANIELDLPNKILFLLKSAKDKDDFIDKANKNLAIYLEAYKVDKEVIDKIQEDAKKQFEDFYKRKNETGILTSIKKFCKGIAVSLHLREKEKSTKKLFGEILTQVEKIKRQRAHEKTVNTKYYSSFTPNKNNTSRSL